MRRCGSPAAYRSVGEVHGLVGILAGEFLHCPEVHCFPIDNEQPSLRGITRPFKIEEARRIAKEVKAPLVYVNSSGNRKG